MDVFSENFYAQVNLEQAIGASGAYFLYGTVCVIGTLFVIFLVPESKGRSPNELKMYDLTNMQSS